MLTASQKLTRPSMTTWQENVGKDIENTKGSGNTFTETGKDGPIRDSWRFKGEIYESAEVKKKRCRQVHLLLRVVLEGVFPDFLMPSALGSHIHYNKVTVKRNHSKLVFFLISCAKQKCRGAESLALKSTFYFSVISRLLTEPLLPAKLLCFSKLLSSACSMAEVVLKLHQSCAWKERSCISI